MRAIFNAAKDFGWLLGIIGFVAGVTAVILVLNVDKAAIKPVAPVGDNITRELAFTPPLSTAIDICQDSASEWTLAGKKVTGFQVAHFKADDHYEGQLTQNENLPNQVKYHLFWRPNLQLDVIIEEARAGTPQTSRTDPHTPEFDTCVKGKKIQEIEPVR